MNLLLVAVLVSSVYAGIREYSVRRYLDGFSDAIVPNAMPEEQKLQAILDWMRAEPSRAIATDPDTLAKRDPEMTLTYRQLLDVCGTATNAFLNLVRSSDLRARRLLLLTPDNNTKHVVAEVLMSGAVDRCRSNLPCDHEGCGGQLSDAQGSAESRDLSRSHQRRPKLSARIYLRSFWPRPFGAVAVSWIWAQEMLGTIAPGWEEAIDWSLLLERESFFYLVLSVTAMLFFLLLRAVLAWYADSRLRVPRFHLREHALRAGVAFFSTPEIKQ